MTIDFKRYLGKQLRITKLKDITFDGKHPNGIDEGFYLDQAKMLLARSEQSGSLHVVVHTPHIYEDFRTSTITKQETFDDHDLIHTQNSIYKIQW